MRPLPLPPPRRVLLALLAALGTAAVLWSLPPPPLPPPLLPEQEAAGSAMPPPRQVTRSLTELGVNVDRAGRELSDHALLFNRVPLAGSELLALLLKWLQAANGFRLVPLPLAGWARTLSATKQEELVTFVTETLRKEAVPVAFHGHMFYTNFSMFDRQSPAYFNLVRDPVDRTLSRFYYSRANTHGKNDHAETHLVKSFLRCVEEFWPECDVRKDLSVPYFCGQDPRCTKLNSPWALTQAKTNIEKYFPVVGVLEDMNATLAVLERRIPLFFSGVKELYYKQLFDSQLRWNFKKYQELRPHVKKELARRIFGQENDLYLWIKQRLMQQLHNQQHKTPLPGEAGQDRIAYSVHSITHLIKH